MSPPRALVVDGKHWPLFPGVDQGMTLDGAPELVGRNAVLAAMTPEQLEATREHRDGAGLLTREERAEKAAAEEADRLARVAATEAMTEEERQAHRDASKRDRARRAQGAGEPR